MRTEIEKRLKKEGWSGKDLSHVDEILEDEKKQEKHAHIKKHLTHFSFWTLLLGVIVINFIMAISIVPFLLFLQGPIILISSIILGFLIGFMFNYMMLELEGLEDEHHVIIILLVPILGVLDVLLINAIMLRLSSLFSVGYNYDAAVLLFVIFFLAPYVVYHIWHRNKERLSELNINI